MDNLKYHRDLVTLLSASVAEVERARRKHPDNQEAGYALMEETGEFAQAVLDKPREEVIKEGLQVIAVVCRTILEPSEGVNRIRESKGLEALGGKDAVKEAKGVPGLAGDST